EGESRASENDAVRSDREKAIDRDTKDMNLDDPGRKQRRYDLESDRRRDADDEHENEAVVEGGSQRVRPALAGSASGDDLDSVDQRERRDQEDQEHRVRHRDRAELGHADPRQEDRIDHMEDGFARLREDDRERNPPDHPREPVSRHTDERRSSAGWTLPRRLTR